MTERIFISLGSNLGQRGRSLKAALCSLSRQVEIVSVSPPLRTPAWGRTDQPDFVNLAAELSTPLPPRELLDLLLRIESEAGRVRAEKWGPRVIDLDILYYGERVIHEPGLTIPHPYIAQRLFVLEPLSAIAPEWIDPMSRLSVLEMRERLIGENK